MRVLKNPWAVTAVVLGLSLAFDVYQYAVTKTYQCVRHPKARIDYPSSLPDLIQRALRNEPPTNSMLAGQQANLPGVLVFAREGRADKNAFAILNVLSGQLPELGKRRKFVHIRSFTEGEALPIRKGSHAALIELGSLASFTEERQTYANALGWLYPRRANFVGIQSDWYSRGLANVFTQAFDPHCALGVKCFKQYRGILPISARLQSQFEIPQLLIHDTFARDAHRPATVEQLSAIASALAKSVFVIANDV